ncbi:MAG: sodium:calcium antiporter, partial [Planktomarina sp.]
GIAAMVGPIPVLSDFLQFDLWVMLAASLILIPFVFWRQNITRIWGVILTAAYVGYLMLVLL